MQLNDRDYLTSEEICRTFDLKSYQLTDMVTNELVTQVKQFGKGRPRHFLPSALDQVREVLKSRGQI